MVEHIHISYCQLSRFVHVRPAVCSWYRFGKIKDINLYRVTSVYKSEYEVRTKYFVRIDSKLGKFLPFYAFKIACQGSFDNSIPTFPVLNYAHHQFCLHYLIGNLPSSSCWYDRKRKSNSSEGCHSW